VILDLNHLEQPVVDIEDGEILISLGLINATRRILIGEQPPQRVKRLLPVATIGRRNAEGPQEEVSQYRSRCLGRRPQGLNHRKAMAITK
jgi:hypothetical protein